MSQGLASELHGRYGIGFGKSAEFGCRWYLWILSANETVKTADM